MVGAQHDHLVSFGPITHHQTSSLTNPSLLDHFPEDFHWFFDYITLSGSINDIYDSFAAGTLIAVSDGSYKDGFGTASLVLEPGEPTGARWRIDVVVNGESTIQSAYRSELMGIYGICVLTWALLESRPVYKDRDTYPNTGITIGCDGQSALNAAFGESAVTSSTLHYDIISAI